MAARVRVRRHRQHPHSRSLNRAFQHRNPRLSIEMWGTQHPDSRSIHLYRSRVVWATVHYSMGMFSRRLLQRALNELEREATPHQMKDWLKRLNKASSDYSATEWEIALLHAFSKLGSVRHEPVIGDSRIDLIIQCTRPGSSFCRRYRSNF